MKNVPQKKIILGIDPGTNVMGYGVIEVSNKKLKLISMGVVKTSDFQSHYDKIHHIFQRTLSLVKQYNPDEVALEAPFFGKNVQSMLKLGRAQGVAMVAALSLDKKVFEYAPLKIKQSITGNGGASKEQVAYFLKSMFKIEILPKELDATDGLAAAVCHHLQQKSPLQKSGATSWSDFVKKNPNKVVK
ncbi:crossover junction endodeoxyribonuclease RuvC [Prolixibacteraceae bacterium]|nr:crossover junction endodeoxyribonuclease RuvC [Prolixibacteraceae bacterium]